MSLLWAIVLIVLLLVCWVTTLVGMPGNWLMLLVCTGYYLLLPSGTRLAVGGTVLLILLSLAVLGEAVELAAGALGVARAGGSRRGALLALIGALVGGLAGLLLGAPIPVIGSLVAALLLAGLGALAGAMIGETWKGRDLSESWAIGKAAFWGRLLGTLAKTMIGAVMIAVVAVALVLD